MLHSEEIDRILSDQIELRNRAPSVESYFENLGVCTDCLCQVAAEWLEINKVMVVAAVLKAETDDPPTLLGLTSFMCGFSLGHVVGSGIATS